MSLFKTGTHRNVLAALYDIASAALSFVLAMAIRLGEDFRFSIDYIWVGTPLFVAVSLCVFFYMRLYRGSWRYASMRDLVNIVKTSSLIILVFALIMFLITCLNSLPRSALFINWMLLIVLLGGGRFIYRALKDHSLFDNTPWYETTRIPVLLVGATDEAERFIRDLARNRHALYDIVAITDNDPKNKGRTIHHIPVYGSTDILDTIIRKLERKNKRPQKIIVAGDISSNELRHLLSLADHFGMPLARLPKLNELKQGIGDKLDIRPIAVEDLLGRSQNVLDRQAMRKLICGKKILVTGAGGTIGGELTRQIASYNPSKLIIVELSEFHLYQIEREIRASFPELPVEIILCDVRDRAHVESIFAKHTPDIVLHAAAIKHVPISEFNIEEAILTNVFGTRNIADCCLSYNTSVMLMISTDKAVNPTNVMGASKRLAESFCQALGDATGNSHKTKFITVRFGNVLGSTGSVVPLFQEQLARGGPLTVTHPEMTRYFMTVREAVELVLQAVVLGNSMTDRKECIFVLDMGQPMKITDLAEQMIRLAGLTPGKDINITFTGLRPGEKLHEELFHGGENVANTSHKSIFLASPRGNDINALRKSLESLFSAASARRTGDALALLKQLVPEFNHDSRYPAA